MSSRTAVHISVSSAFLIMSLVRGENRNELAGNGFPALRWSELLRDWVDLKLRSTSL